MQTTLIVGLLLLQTLLLALLATGLHQRHNRLEAMLKVHEAASKRRHEILGGILGRRR